MEGDRHGRRQTVWGHLAPTTEALRRVLMVGWLAIGVSLAVTAVDVASSGWTPVVDNAVISAMVVDSASVNPPLIGPPTSAGVGDGATLHHAGPLGLWLMAAPTVALGDPGEGLILGALLLSLTSLGGIAVLLRRRGDVLLDAVGLAVVGSLVASLGAQKLVDPYNPYVGILPLLLALVAASGVLAGHHRQMWVLVPAASLAAQSHLGYVPLVLALVLVIMPSTATDAARLGGARRRRLTRKIVPVALAAGVACWSGPMVDLAFGSRNLYRFARGQPGRPAAGLDHGLDVAVEMTSVPPRWVIGRARDQDLSDPTGLRLAASLAAVGLVAGLLVHALRHLDRPLAAMAATTYVALGAAILSSARLAEPDARQFLPAEHMLLYRLLWWPVGAFFALTLVWGVGRVALSWAAAHTDLAAVGRRLSLPAAGVVAASVALLLVTTHQPYDDALVPYYRQQEANADAIADLPGSPDEVVLRFTGDDRSAAPSAAEMRRRRVEELQDGPHGVYSHAANLLAQLRLRGIEVEFAEEPDDGYMYLRPYRMEHEADGDEDVEILFLAGPAVADDPPTGYRRISASGAADDDPRAALLTPTAVYVRSPVTG